MIAPELAEDEHFRTRFLREPRLAASLDHPNVIPIYEAGEHEGQLYRVRFVGQRPEADARAERASWSPGARWRCWRRWLGRWMLRIGVRLCTVM